MANRIINWLLKGEGTQTPIRETMKTIFLFVWLIVLQQLMIFLADTKIAKTKLPGFEICVLFFIGIYVVREIYILFMEEGKTHYRYVTDIALTAHFGLYNYLYPHYNLATWGYVLWAIVIFYVVLHTLDKVERAKKKIREQHENAKV